MQNRKRDTDVQNRLLDSVGEGEGGMFWVNSIETCMLSRMKQITSPGWMHETSARTWCTGKTQRDGVGREAGGGSGWGTHVNPCLIHVNVWQKPLQYCKVISLQLIKINGKKIKLCKRKNKTKQKNKIKWMSDKWQGIRCLVLRPASPWLSGWSAAVHLLSLNFSFLTCKMIRCLLYELLPFFCSTTS